MPPHTAPMTGPQAGYTDAYMVPDSHGGFNRGPATAGALPNSNVAPGGQQEGVSFVLKTTTTRKTKAMKKYAMIREFGVLILHCGMHVLRVS